MTASTAPSCTTVFGDDALCGAAVCAVAAIREKIKSREMEAADARRRVVPICELINERWMYRLYTTQRERLKKRKTRTCAVIIEPLPFWCGSAITREGQNYRQQQNC